jgi:hypothetical protein
VAAESSVKQISKKMKTNLVDAKELLTAVSPDLRLIHTNTRALQRLVSAYERTLVSVASIALPMGGNNDPDPYGNVNAACLSMIVESRSARSIESTIQKAMLEVLENSAEFKKACDLIDPLLAAIAAQDEEEQSRQSELHRSRGALNKAREEARQRAVEAAENDPDVIAAKQRVEQTETVGASPLKQFFKNATVFRR